jgi:ammonia channel protein AmtB
MNAADTALIIVATALVLFMTLPGPALFCGCLSRVTHSASSCIAMPSLAPCQWHSSRSAL